MGGAAAAPRRERQRVGVDAEQPEGRRLGHDVHRRAAEALRHPAAHHRRVRDVALADPEGHRRGDRREVDIPRAGQHPGLVRERRRVGDRRTRLLLVDGPVLGALEDRAVGGRQAVGEALRGLLGVLADLAGAGLHQRRQQDGRPTRQRERDLHRAADVLHRVGLAERRDRAAEGQPGDAVAGCRGERQRVGRAAGLGEQAEAVEAQRIGEGEQVARHAGEALVVDGARAEEAGTVGRDEPDAELGGRRRGGAGQPRREPGPSRTRTVGPSGAPSEM